MNPIGNLYYVCYSEIPVGTMGKKRQNTPQFYLFNDYFFCFMNPERSNSFRNSEQGPDYPAPACRINRSTAWVRPDC